MKLPRPYIPIDVRLAVANRQAQDWGLIKHPKSNLAELLYLLFGNQPVHLDHDPALMLRAKRITDGEMEYLPDANDPDFLIYRTAAEHKIKTLVRGDGAQHSDAALARKNKRIAKNRDPKRRKYKWAKRKFGSIRSV